MKYVRTMITTVLLLAVVSVAVKAQERPILTATVPFAFTLENTDLPARKIAEEAMKIAGTICIYTNQNFTVEELSGAAEKTSATTPVH